MVGSAQGGMEIEELAVNNPDAITKIYIEPAVVCKTFKRVKWLLPWVWMLKY